MTSASERFSPHRRGRGMGLLRRHPQGAIEADDLAVEHLVLDDVTGEAGVLLGPAEARGKWDPGAERLALLLGERCQKRSVEEPRRDRDDADAAAGQIPR